MKSKKMTVLLVIICIAGLSLVLYPTISNYWNARHSTMAINDYVQQVQNITEEDYQQVWNDAYEYNTDLLHREDMFSLTDRLKERYRQNLNPAENGMMGYIEIGKLSVSLPIYHGTADETLQTAIGHLEWSSLPVGGENTHCVLSGHRGLPSAKLFTDLDQLREGDTFTLNILKETLTYEIDQIRTVLPEDVSDLQIERGKDYCTLITCTPYGINTHRMLVRGHRVENVAGVIRVVSEAVSIDPLLVASVITLPPIVILLAVVFLRKPKQRLSVKERYEAIRRQHKQKTE